MGGFLPKSCGWNKEELVSTWSLQPETSKEQWLKHVETPVSETFGRSKPMKGDSSAIPSMSSALQLMMEDLSS